MNRRNFLMSGSAFAVFAAKVSCATSSNAKTITQDGFAPVPGGKVWWRKVGDGARTPLLVVHGGPGTGHDYLEPLAALADQRPVIFYDQLGCGRSDMPDNPSLWRIGRFAEEIDSLLRYFKLDKVILYGHSFGGAVVQEYMAQPFAHGHVEALILASTAASYSKAMAGMQKLLAEMPGDFNARRIKLEKESRQNSPEYAAIVDAFYKAHLFCSSGPPPAIFTNAVNNVGKSKTCIVMNGPNEFTMTGTLKDWDRTADLSAITVPTLVLTSEWDEATMDTQIELHHKIKGSQLVVIPKARHLAMIEKPAEYNAALRSFMAPFA